jgi:hypothetical protein
LHEEPIHKRAARGNEMKISMGIDGGTDSVRCCLCFGIPQKVLRKKFGDNEIYVYICGIIEMKDVKKGVYRYSEDLQEHIAR